MATIDFVAVIVIVQELLTNLSHLVVHTQPLKVSTVVLAKGHFKRDFHYKAGTEAGMSGRTETLLRSW